jgi:hypothetical protein
MTDSTGDEAAALREELARLLGDMTVTELKALLQAVTEIGRARARGQRKAKAARAGAAKRRQPG